MHAHSHMHAKLPPLCRHFLLSLFVLVIFLQLRTVVDIYINVKRDDTAHACTPTHQHTSTYHTHKHHSQPAPTDRHTNIHTHHIHTHNTKRTPNMQPSMRTSFRTHKHRFPMQNVSHLAGAFAKKNVKYICSHICTCTHIHPETHIIHINIHIHSLSH